MRPEIFVPCMITKALWKDPYNYLDGRLADLNQWGTVIEIAIIALFSILIIYCKWVVHNMCVYSTVCSALLDSSASPHTSGSSISAPL